MMWAQQVRVSAAYVVQLVIWVVGYLVPLRGLYFHGPALQGYGFWGGAAPSDICAQLTAVPATVWARTPDNMDECDALLERKFRAFQYLVWTVLYLWVAHSLVATLWMRYAVIKPLAAELRATLVPLLAQRQEHQHQQACAPALALQDLTCRAPARAPAAAEPKGMG